MAKCNIHRQNDVGGARKVDGLAVHSGRNNEANKIVRTDSYGYIQCGYIDTDGGNEKNNSAPPYVWGTNGSDNYLRTYNINHIVLNKVYPVGTLMLRLDQTSPASFLGGSWALCCGDRFLVAGYPSSSMYPTPGMVGGSNSHTLTVNEMPSHTHSHNHAIANGGGRAGAAYSFGWVASGWDTATGSNTSEVRFWNGDTGGGAAFDERPLYVSVFVWQRVS